MYHPGNYPTPKELEAKRKAEEEQFFTQLEVKIRNLRNRLYERYSHRPEKLKEAQERLANLLKEPYQFKP